MNVLSVQSKTITLSAAILAVSSIISGLLGVLRNWILAGRFPARDLDVYFAAFRIPDFIYQVLIFGGVVVAFMPLFSEYYSKNKDDAWRFANNTLNAFFLFLIGVCAVVFLFALPLTRWVAPGFDPAQAREAAFLTRLMLVSPVLFGISSIFSGILQYFHRFLAYSIAPILYNLGIIAGILFFSSKIGIMSAAVGVIFGAVLYLLIQIPPALRCGFCFKPAVNFREVSLIRVFSLMIPRTLGVASDQINQSVATFMASRLATGAITAYNLSGAIETLPVGIIGISYAMAAFPAFAKAVAASSTKELAKKFSEVYRQIGFAVIPASFLIFALRAPIVDILYAHGQFSEASAVITAAALGIFCIGMFFDAAMPLLFRLFFAFHDTVSPTISTTISVVANVAFNFVFIDLLRQNQVAGALVRSWLGVPLSQDVTVLGLVAAYVLANILQFSILAFLLFRKKRQVIAAKEIILSYIKIIIASLAMFIVMNVIYANIHPASKIMILAALAGVSLAGSAVYIAAAAMLRLPEILAAAKFLSRKKENGTS
jgi:putative peptidoglycan lipid II flippase